MRVGGCTSNKATSLIEECIKAGRRYCLFSFQVCCLDGGGGGVLYRGGAGGGGGRENICRVWDADFLLVRAKCKNLWF